jgi:putative ABC transport system substrate-binding protein
MLAVREKIATVFASGDAVTAGGLMSYSTDIADSVRQVGVYTGRVLRGEKPADMPVLQLSKFILVINLQTAQTLGIEVPAGLLSIADEVIE